MPPTSYPVGRGVGAIWQAHTPGNESRWYTRRPDGKVVPTKDPRGGDQTSDGRPQGSQGEEFSPIGLTERETPEEAERKRILSELTPEKLQSMSTLERIIKYIELARLRGMTLEDVRLIAMHLTYISVGEIKFLTQLFDIDETIQDLATQIDLR